MPRKIKRSFSVGESRNAWRMALALGLVTLTVVFARGTTPTTAERPHDARPQLFRPVAPTVLQPAQEAVSPATHVHEVKRLPVAPASLNCRLDELPLGEAVSPASGEQAWR